MEYNIYKYGQVTKFEAGVFYRNMKQGNIEVMKETISMFYDEIGAEYRLAQSRYSQDGRYYDAVYNAVEALLADDFAKAQELINWIQEDCIKRAGKKSRFYKYQ